MRKHFLELFDYNNWANERLLAALEEHSVDDEETLKLFSHLVSAQIIWLNRIKDLPTSPFPLWEIYKLREIKSMVEESNRNWKSYVSEEHKANTFEEMIFYKNSEDIKFESTIKNIMTHVINHSSYHRGQISKRLRSLSIDPPATDFIIYTRHKI